MEPGGHERRRLLPLPLANGNAAPPHDMSTEYSSSTLTSPSSEWTESTLSSDSWSSESIDITSDGGSDSTDFTPGEFVDYPRLPHLSSSSRPNSGSSDTLHSGGGPYVARITVTGPANHSFTSTSPVRERASRPRSEVVVAPLFREHDAPVQTYNCEVPFKHPKTARNEWSPNSPVADRKIHNGTARLVEPHEVPAPRKDNCKVPFKYAKTWEDERITSSAVRGSRSRDGTVGLVEKQVPERAVSAKCGSPLKFPTKRMSTTNSNCFFVSPANDRVSRHTIPPQVADGDAPTPQMNNGEAFVECGRKSSNDSSSSFTTEDRSSHHRSVSSTASSAVELEAPAWRKSKRSKQPTSCSVTSSSAGCRTNGRSAIVGDCGAVDHDGPGRRKNGRESGSKNDEEHHRNRNLSGKGRDVTHRRGSGGSNAIIKDAAFHRCSGPDAESSSKYPGDVLCSSAADNRVEAPRQGFDRADQKRTPVNQHVTGTETSERATEQDRWHQAKAAQMKRYCLDQLKLPSKSIPEVARRRRGKQRRMIAGEISGSPDSLLATKTGAQAAPREYASRHEYPLYSTTTTTRDSVPPPIIDDASKMSSGKTLCQQQSLITTRDNKHVSETLEGHRGRLWTDNSDRKRKVLERPSPEEDRSIRASVTARTDCSSASGRSNTVSRGGRLSVTITSNEPEPETHWAIDVGRMTLPSLEAECLRNVRPGNEKETYSGQIYGNDVINRKYIQARKNSASSDSDDDYNCGKSSCSSEGTVRGICEREYEETRSTRRKEYFRRCSKRTSSSSGHSCVDAAVQVEVEELERKDRDGSSCPPTSERDSGVKSLSADSEWTDTGHSPESESSYSKYFRRSGKDVWRASMALHSSHRKGSADVQSETSRTNSEQSTTTKTSRRRHRTAGHQEHLANTSQINNHREKTAEVVPIVFQTSQTSSVNWSNETEISAKEKLMTTMGKDDGRLGELSSETRNHNGNPRTSHGCRKTFEDQMSNVQIESAVGSLDSSLVDVVVQNGCRQELDRVANRIPSLGVDDTSDEQAKYEIHLAARDRSREIRQRGLDKTRDEDTFVITRNISNGPTRTCGQLPDFTQTNDVARNTHTLRSTPGSRHSISSSLDASPVGVVAERRVAKEQGMIDREDATPEVLETAGQRNMTDTSQLFDHHRCDNLQQGRQSSMEPANDFSSKSCQRAIAETCHRGASLTTTRKENFQQGDPDMTSTDNKPNRKLSSCPPDALLQHVSSPPERPTFFSRLFNRWPL